MQAHGPGVHLPACDGLRQAVLLENFEQACQPLFMLLWLSWVACVVPQLSAADGDMFVAKCTIVRQPLIHEEHIAGQHAGQVARHEACDSTAACACLQQ